MVTAYHKKTKVHFCKKRISSTETLPLCLFHLHMRNAAIQEGSKKVHSLKKTIVLIVPCL